MRTNLKVKGRDPTRIAGCSLPNSTNNVSIEWGSVVVVGCKERASLARGGVVGGARLLDPLQGYPIPCFCFVLFSPISLSAIAIPPFHC